MKSLKMMSRYVTLTHSSCRPFRDPAAAAWHQSALRDCWGTTGRQAAGAAVDADLHPYLPPRPAWCPSVVGHPWQADLCRSAPSHQREGGQEAAQGTWGQFCLKLFGSVFTRCDIFWTFAYNSGYGCVFFLGGTVTKVCEKSPFVWWSRQREDHLI